MTRMALAAAEATRQQQQTKQKQPKAPAPTALESLLRGGAAAGMPAAAKTPDTLQLERLREQLGAEQVALLNASGQSLVAAGGSAGAAIAPERR